jgi:hypothetical protein
MANKDTIPASIQKTQEEIDLMTRAELEEYNEQQHMIVYGYDYKRIRGVPQEQGKGARGRETENHFVAIRKYEGEEPYWTAVAEIWKRDPDRAQKLRLPKPKQAAPAPQPIAKVSGL